MMKMMRLIKRMITALIKRKKKKRKNDKFYTIKTATYYLERNKIMNSPYYRNNLT